MQKMSTAINHFLHLVLFIIVAVMSVLYFGNVVLRYAFNSGIPIAEEACRFLFVYLVFLGAIAGLKDNEHMGIDLVVKKLPLQLKKIVFVVSNLLVIYGLWLVLQGSWQMTLAAKDSHSPAIGLPMSYIYMIGIIASISMTLIIFRNLYGVMFKSASVDELITVKHSEETLGHE